MARGRTTAPPPPPDRRTTTARMACGKTAENVLTHCKSSKSKEKRDYGNQLQRHTTRQPQGLDGRTQVVDTLCSDVEKMSTATDGDVRAVLSTALYCIEQALRRSESVTLGDLGTFAVGLSSTGTDTAEEFTAANISKARVTFRPARRLKELAKAFQYKRVEVRPHI